MRLLQQAGVLQAFLVHAREVRFSLLEKRSLVFAEDCADSLDRAQVFAITVLVFYIYMLISANLIFGIKDVLPNIQSPP
jgi:hypothetical protein